MARRNDHIAQEPAYPAEATRGGQIILTTRRRRLVFLGGLVAFVLFALIAAILAPRCSHAFDAPAEQGGLPIGTTASLLYTHSVREGKCAACRVYLCGGATINKNKT